MADYNILVGEETEHPVPSSSQVYKVTHDGDKRLPFLRRSFISFTYGEDASGRPVPIEDFNLISTFDGDRLSRQAYASFNDLTSNYDVIHGQFFWGSYYTNNSLTFKLATDEMSQEDLDRFKYWFKAGTIRELILAEHPNRAIMARVATPPEIELLPFEKRVTVHLKDKEFQTSTTVYRGEITLELTMDDPFWYAKQNILGTQDANGNYESEDWVDANGVQASILESEDAIKIIYEDHIPIGSQINVGVFLGGNLYATLSYEYYSKIADIIEKSDYDTAQEEITGDERLRRAYLAVSEPVIDEETGEQKIDPETNMPVTQLVYYKGAYVADEETWQQYGALVAGAQTGPSKSGAQGIPLLPGDNNPAYLYYAGTAPSPVKMRFTLKPEFNNACYIITPQSKLSNPDQPYNTITLEATNKHEFKFTLPAFWQSYNYVLQIFDNPEIIRIGNAWLTVRETIRDTIRHPIIREWANRVLDNYDTKGQGIAGIITPPEEGTFEGMIGDMKSKMKELLTHSTQGPYPAHFTFDGRTGEAIGEFTYTVVNSDGEISTATSVENVGDMVKSSYLILDERNVLDSQFRIQPWSENTPQYTYKITHDLYRNVEDGLEDVHFEFKNMYL